jgi:hypothetical protein
LQSCVTKHGNPRLRAALVELAWRLVRFQRNLAVVQRVPDANSPIAPRAHRANYDETKVRKRS